MSPVSPHGVCKTEVLVLCHGKDRNLSHFSRLVSKYLSYSRAIRHTQSDSLGLITVPFQEVRLKLGGLSQKKYFFHTVII
jgi:hypothetical protein